MADNEMTPADDRRVGSTAAPAQPEVQSATGTPPQNTKAAPVETTSGAGVKRPGDRVFEFLSTASATLITVIIIAIGLFLSLIHI